MILSGCDNNASTSKTATPLAVDTQTVTAQPITLGVQLPGRISAAQAAEVRPQVGGIILKRLFKEGSEVHAGQQLYQIDPSTYQAAYEKARAQYLDSQHIYQRYQRLAAADAVSKQDLQTAQSTYLQAQADLTSAKVNLEFTQVKASISGRIGRSSVTQGALVTSDQTTALATITQLDPMYVDITQSSSDLLKLRRALSTGQLEKVGANAAEIKLMLEDGSEYPLTGRLEFSEVQVDQGTGSVTLRATFPNPDGVLLPGMFVRATMDQAVAQQGILIPQSAVLRDSRDYPYVYLIAQNNQVKQQQITLGQMQKGLWQVTQGLTPGDQLVVDNLQSLTEGIQVRPEKAARLTPAPSHISLSMTDNSAQ